MSQLRRAGLVRVRKGNKGGFMLARPPDEIRISEILSAVEGNLEIVECVKNKDLCERSDICKARKIWTEASRVMIHYFESTTLASVLTD